MAVDVLDRLQIDRRGARDGAVPDPEPPPHVAVGVPPRHRGSGNRQGIRRAGRHRGSAEDAVPADAGRHRSRQPGNVDAVEGGADLASLRRHLQPPDAALRRRADRAEPGRADRPAGAAAHGLPEAEITRFLEGLPQRYLQLFPRDAIYRHVRLARDIRPDEVHVSLERQRSAVWTLAVVTLDKPFLFSNICGVLSSFGMNILRGHALTNPNGLVLDVFQFTDDERFLALNPRRADRGAAHPAGRRLRPRGRDGAAARPRAERAAVARVGARWRRSCAPTTKPPAATPFSTSSRQRARAAVPDQPRHLPARLRRRPGAHINGRGEGAIDVFHITKAGAKLTEAEQRALTSDLQGTLEGTL